MRYAVVIEKAKSNYSAYVPDLPGCVATGATVKETQQQIQEAIAFHLSGLREESLPIPQPTTFCEYVEASYPSSMNPNDDKRKGRPTISQLVAQPSLEDKPPLELEKEGKLQDT